jgi:hypothetical protein
MSKIVKILSKVLSLAFVFAVLLGGVSASAAAVDKGPYPGRYCAYQTAESNYGSSQCKNIYGNIYTPDPDTNCRNRYGGTPFFFYYYGYQSNGRCYINQ